MEPPKSSEPTPKTYNTGDESAPPQNDAAAKARHERLFQNGLIWLGVGIFLMGLSLLFNFFLVEHDKSFVIPMYAVTTAGAGALMKGLYDIMG